jgi:hypothetical protein
LARFNVELFSCPAWQNFASGGTAAEEGLGMEPGEFMEAYAAAPGVNQLAMEADPVAVAVVKLMEGRNEWIGTAGELLRELGKLVDEDVRRYKTCPAAQPPLPPAQAPRSRPAGRGHRGRGPPRQGSERKKRLYKKKPRK